MAVGRLGTCVTASALLLLMLALRADAEPVTFADDVAPLLFRHCATCHRPGGSSNTALLTYLSAKTHARQIVQMTAAHVMPPWQPEGARNVFEGDRRLASEEIDVFRRWLEDGVLEGEPRHVPATPVFSTDWELGKPDLVLTMPAYTLRADGPDMFRNFVLPVPVDRTRYVRAWEFHPGNPRVVHHATMQVDATGSSSRYDEADPDAGYEGLIAPAARAPEGFFLDWAPGHRPNVAVPDTAWLLPPSSDLVMMLHLRPSGRAEQVQASVALYFSDVPPSRTPVMLRLTRQELDIPSGAANYTVSDRYVLPVDVELHTVQPHAHYLAREMSGVATTPDGTVIPLLSIRDWDFNWQDVYRFAKPIHLSAGTALTMTIGYDNTPSNPRNPSRPPVRVRYGQRTSDEMAELWFQVLPVHAADRDRLVDSLYRKVLPEEIKGRRAMLLAEPRNVALHDDLALMLAETADLAGAEREFRESLALRPDSAASRFNVGLAVLGQGRIDEARRWFASALEADPLHGATHFQLGLLQQASGDLAGASAHLATALSAKPRDADVLLAAGVLDALLDQDASAVQRLRGALEVRPGWVNAEAALASVLSSTPGGTKAERDEAVRLAEHASVRAPGNSAFLDILAGALAATGDTRRAVAVERDALRIAESAGNRAAAESMRARIATWENRAP